MAAQPDKASGSGSGGAGDARGGPESRGPAGRGAGPPGRRPGEPPPPGAEGRPGPRRVPRPPAASATLLQRVGARAGGERLSGWVRSRGASDDQLAEITGWMAGAVAFHARLARSDFDVEHDSLPLGPGTGLRAVWTPGHTPG